MDLKKTLEKLLRDSDETDDWGSPGRDDDAELLVPIIEQLGKESYLAGWNDALATKK